MINECYARGTPIVASAIGPIAEVVADGRTGLHFRPGDVDDLVAKVNWLLDHPDEQAALREGARHEFERRYTAEANLAQLLAIYERAIRMHQTVPTPRPASAGVVLSARRRGGLGLLAIHRRAHRRRARPTRSAPVGTPSRRRVDQVTSRRVGLEGFRAVAFRCGDSYGSDARRFGRSWIWRMPRGS